MIIIESNNTDILELLKYLGQDILCLLLNWDMVIMIGQCNSFAVKPSAFNSVLMMLS